MSFKDDLRKRLSDEQFQQVTDALGDDFNYDVVPRSRLNKVIGQRDKLKELIEGNSDGTQHQGGSGEHHEEDDFNMPDGKGKKKSASEEELRQQFEAQKNAEINALRVEFAGLDILRTANAVDPKLVFSLLDKEKLTMGEDGKLTGMDDQLKAIQEARPYLFKADGGSRDNTPGGTGKHDGSEKFDAVKSKEDFLKLSYQEQLKFKEAHPQVFQKFLNS